MMDMPLPASPKYGTVPYGDRTFGDLFTARQLVAITTFSDLIGEARARIREDDHAAAVILYLACAMDSMGVRCCRVSSWDLLRESCGRGFGRQAIPMVWDYAEGNPLGAAAGGCGMSIQTVTRALRGLA